MTELTQQQVHFIQTFLGVDIAPDSEEQARAEALEKTGIAEGTVRKRAFLMTRWRQIPAELKAEIDRLKDAMIEHVPEEDPADLAKSMQAKLDEFCVEMQDALDDAINAGDPGYKKSVALIDTFRVQVSSDPLVQHIMDNPFEGGTDIETVLLTAFDDMQKELAA